MPNIYGLFDGGESGIRTHGTFNSTHTFQACALNHSATSPLIFKIFVFIPIKSSNLSINKSFKYIIF